MMIPYSGLHFLDHRVNAIWHMQTKPVILSLKYTNILVLWVAWFGVF